MDTASAEPYEVAVRVPADSIPRESLHSYWLQCDTFMPLASPPADLEATRCSTHKESTTRAPIGQRSGGWLIACASDGYILHLKEFFGTESLSQRYFFLAELKAAMPTLTDCIHDDACHLRRFADARAHESPAAWSLAYPQMNHIIDGMHARGHVDAWCLANCHPKVPANAARLQGVNTSICEQTFRQTNRYKFMVQHMGRCTCTVFLHEVADARNDLKLQESAMASIQPPLQA